MNEKFWGSFHKSISSSPYSMGWKFQTKLKLDISFSLEYFFISVAIFTEVDSVPLNGTLTFLEKTSKVFASHIFFVSAVCTTLMSLNKKKIIPH